MAKKNYLAGEYVDQVVDALVDSAITGIPITYLSLACADIPAVSAVIRINTAPHIFRVADSIYMPFDIHIILSRIAFRLHFKAYFKLRPTAIFTYTLK